MKKMVNQWLKLGVFGVSALLAAAACSDDHFDVKTEGTAQQSIWENIESNQELSDFTAILKRTRVMKEENDRNATLMAADLLKQPQSFTLWAPINGTFDAKKWNDTLDVAEKLRAQGTPEALKQAREIDNMVWRQFVGNHMARFAHEAKGNETEVRLINNKYGEYTGAAFNKIPLMGSSIVSNNGTVHFLKGVSPFAYNIYDYLSSTPALSSINAYIKDPEIDKHEFIESASTPGAMNEVGKMVYIDSIYRHYNTLLDNSGAAIRNEDSTTVALIPTNTAWTEAIEKVSQLFNYGTKYNKEFKSAEGGLGDFTKKDNTNALILSGASKTYPGRTLADSLKEYRTRQAIVTNLFFAPYLISGGETMDSAALMNHFNMADSLISTTGTVFYNPAAVKGMLNANQNPVLAGLIPYRASNGYIFSLENYAFDPAYSFVKEITYQPVLASTYYNTGATNAILTAQTLSITNYNNYRAKLDVNGDTILDTDGQPVMTGVKGTVKDNIYQRYQMKSTREDMVIDFRLNDVYSAAYTIELVMVPSKINYDIVNDPDADNEVVKFTAEIIADDSNNAYSNQKVTIDQTLGQFSQDSVQVIKLWDKMTFKKCYANLPAGTESFARLRLTVPRISTRPGAVKTANALNIVEVRLKPYRAQ